MPTLKVFLLMLAMVLFAIAILWQPPRVNLIAAGLFLWVATLVIP